MHVKFVQGRLEFPILSRKDRGKCAVQGFKLRYTGLSIDRPIQRSHVIDGPVTGLQLSCREIRPPSKSGGTFLIYPKPLMGKNGTQQREWRSRILPVGAPWYTHKNVLTNSSKIFYNIPNRKTCPYQMDSPLLQDYHPCECQARKQIHRQTIKR